MQYNRLGRTGVKVSRIGLGALNFGFVTDQEASFEILNYAVENGINLVDTANVYGGPQTPDMEKGFGTSEEIIGRWLAEDPTRRDRIVLTSKVYQPMETGPNDRGLSAYHIRRACEASLRRLQTDHIDLYQMHHVDRNVPWEETWQAFEQLIREGKISYVGSSNFAGWDIATAQTIANSRGFLGLASEQSLYNLTERTIELEVIPALRHYGIGLIPWSSLGRGLLGGVLENTGTGRRSRPEMQARIEAIRPQLEAYESLCKEVGAPPAHVAQAWLLANPVVSTIICGPRTCEQLADSAKTLDVTLSPEVLARLDEIWPGPGGEAPAAYAW
ncbi:aldo/keto reductase [Tsukamurella sp. PLM1]|uniref:aldo/keto reductase n=1 Tax=Tsukamurella sp. PLM1 TaxID=2929795 RepID=UPI002045C1C1|nr:aldo/keto reductase [Tsukamurella sp. PLM1]BDH56523.1 oxidoreductase [Tsukamurella sp. PLM1]